MMRIIWSIFLALEKFHGLKANHLPRPPPPTQAHVQPSTSVETTSQLSPSPTASDPGSEIATTAIPKQKKMTKMKKKKKTEVKKREQENCAELVNKEGPKQNVDSFRAYTEAENSCDCRHGVSCDSVGVCNCLSNFHGSSVN